MLVGHLNHVVLGIIEGTVPAMLDPSPTVTDQFVGLPDRHFWIMGRVRISDSKMIKMVAENLID